MTNSRSSRRAFRARKKQATLITAKSGIKVNIFDDEWQVLSYKGKGHRIPVAWLHDSDMPDEDWNLILDAYTHYVRTKAASTASGIVTNTKPFLVDGIPELTSLRTSWSGLQTNHKKGLNQFFGTLSKLGYKRFAAYHDFTTKRLDKNVNNIFDPSKGALSECEFDSLAKEINNKLREFDWSVPRDLSFYKPASGFNAARNSVAIKLIVSTVRRPIQLMVLKWADLIPAGASFNDKNIDAGDEIRTIGAQTLQLRVFYAKANGEASPRAYPERYPIHLSEDLSATLLEYKKLCFRGFSLLMETSGLKLDQAALLDIMNNIPIFPDTALFNLQLASIEMLKSLFTPHSTALHCSESLLTSAIRQIKIASDRAPDCIATNNRIRHTVLTRGAQEGLSAVQLARITGVTVPAARHYVDMDYESRRLIDENFIGNEFLKRAFGGTITLVPEGEEIIVDHEFNDVGGARSRRTCQTCQAELGRPLGCYGCPNFRPILEANHTGALQFAEDKLRANQAFLLNPLRTKTIEKLQRQIEWVKLTITLCEEILAKQRAIDVEQIS
jgi:hypothetical protein